MKSSESYVFKVCSKYKFLAMLYVLENELCKRRIFLGKHAIGEVVRVSL